MVSSFFFFNFYYFILNTDFLLFIEKYMPMKNISIGGVIILDRAQLENDEKEEVRLRVEETQTKHLYLNIIHF